MERCPYCEEEVPLEEMERFYSHHEECFIRTVFGSAAHQLEECTCYGGTREDPPGVSRREAAKLAYDAFRIRHTEEA